MESENLSVTVGSTFSQDQDHDDKNKEGQDLKKKKIKKFKNLRSFKLSKSPSTRRSKSQFRNIVVDLSSDTENSSYSTSSSQLSSLSDARTDISKKLARTLTRRSSFKGVRSLTRMSSKKLRKPLMRKFSGGNELSQMKSSRSTRPVNSKSDHDQFSIVSTPNPSKSASSSNARKMRFQASPRTPEHSFSSSAGQKSAMTLTRKASLKPLRASTKPKRDSIKIHSENSQIPDSSVERATCSSTLKDSKFADSPQLQQGGSESEGTSAMKVCPFSYCSLHGHRHANVPPLKRLISIRRRMLKNQKSTRRENRPVRGETNSGKAKRGVQKNLGEAKSNGFSNYGEEDAKLGESSSLSETLIGETSHPLPELEENHNQNGEFSIVEHDSLLTVAAPMQNSGKPEKPDSETSDKEEKSVASREEDGESDSALNGSELADKNLERNGATTGKPPDELTTATADDGVETRNNIGTSLASQSVLENEQEADNKEEKENLEPDHGFFQFPPRGSEPNSPSNAAPRMQLKDQKYVRMWRLMYKHAVKGVAEKIENQPHLDGVDKTEQVGESQVLVESNNSQSSQHSSETDRDIPKELVNEGNQQMDRYQIDAVKLVQEAFDQILLPEIQELSPDDGSVTSRSGADREVFDQDQVDGEQQINGTESTSSLKEERILPKAGDKPNQKVSKSWSNLKKIIILKRFVKALDKVKKINRGTPQYLPLQPEHEAEKVNLRRQTSVERKNTDEWMLDFALQQVISKLDPAQQRKVAILVKAFETVLPMPDLQSSPMLNVDQVKAWNNVPVQTDENAGKATNEENFDEVLVGETSPSAKSGNDYADQVSDFLKAEPRNEAEFPKIEETCEESSCIKQELVIPLSEATDEDRKEEKSSASNIDDWNSKEILPTDQPDSFTTFEEIDLHKPFGELNEDDTKSSCDEVLHNGNVEEVQKHVDTSLTSEPGNAGKELYGMTLESNDIVRADSEQLDESKEQAIVDEAESITEKDESEFELAQGSPPSEESDPDSTTDAAQDTQLEKQSYMRLWGFVYKHMMTGVAANEGTNLRDESDDEKSDDTKTLSATNVPVSGQSFPEKHQDTGIKDEAADKKRAALRRFEAIKLIEKAIDEILLPENQENSHGAQSTASDLIPDDEPHAKNIAPELKPFISDSNESSGESGKKEGEDCRVTQCEERATISSDTTVQEEQKISSNKQMPRSWSNLKKMILLKRFIKALENVKKFNPRGPRFLPLEADPEAEKVNLKHLEMDERRSAEEWKLDYALQQAVTRLTPARKRKVKLLVEAFETVTPTIRS